MHSDLAQPARSLALEAQSGNDPGRIEGEVDGLVCRGSPAPARLVFGETWTEFWCRSCSYDGVEFGQLDPVWDHFGTVHASRGELRHVVSLGEGTERGGGGARVEHHYEEGCERDVSSCHRFGTDNALFCTSVGGTALSFIRLKFHQKQFAEPLDMGQHAGEQLQGMRAHHGGYEGLKFGHPWPVYVRGEKPESRYRVHEENGAAL